VSAVGVRVIAVVELPWALSEADGGPKEPVTADVEGYRKSRQDWFTHHGVSAPAPDGIHADVSTIRSDFLLDLLIDSSIETSDPGNPTGLYEDAGFVVMVDGASVSRPGCCCSFWEAIAEWKRVLDERSTEWSMLWIGHPWQMVRVVGEQIELSVSSESNDVSVLAATLPLEAIKEGLAKAETSLGELATSVASRLDQRGLPSDSKYVRALLGLEASE
jgi:hypothetical protein